MWYNYSNVRNVLVGGGGHPRCWLTIDFNKWNISRPHAMANTKKNSWVTLGSNLISTSVSVYCSRSRFANTTPLSFKGLLFVAFASEFFPSSWSSRILSFAAQACSYCINMSTAKWYTSYTPFSPFPPFFSQVQKNQRDVQVLVCSMFSWPQFSFPSFLSWWKPSREFMP